MQKNSKWVYLWDVIYPVGMYLVISNIVMFLLGLVAPANNENYIVRHIIVSVVSLPFILSYYRRPPVYCIEVAEKKRIRPEVILLALAAGAAFGVALNNLIGLTPLVSWSASYQEISEAFYGSTLILEILATCVITPILEELLYRGVAYQRLRGWLGILPAILCSSLLFGVMHLNLVQFLYAGLIGALLAWLIEYFGLTAATSAHVGANLISVLRSECGILSLSGMGMGGIVVETGIAAVLCVLSVWLLWRKVDRDYGGKYNG